MYKKSNKDCILMRSFSDKKQLNSRNLNTTRLVNKLYFSHFKKKVFNLLLLSKNFQKKIVIKVAQNNFFCSLISLTNNKTIHISSAGRYKIKVSKRKFKKIYINFLNIFFYKIQKHTPILSDFIFLITAPIHIRRKIFNFIQKRIESYNKVTLSNKLLDSRATASNENFEKYRNILISIPPKKCFNGCRVQKRVRKKRRLYRIFKS